MGIKDDYQRAYSLFRYAEQDFDSDYRNRRMADRDVRAEMTPLSNVAIGAAYKAHMIGWYGIRQWEAGRYKKYLEDKPKNRYFISSDLTDKEMKAVKARMNREYRKCLTDWYATIRKQVQAICSQRYAAPMSERTTG